MASLLLVEHHDNGFGEEHITDSLGRLATRGDYRQRPAHGAARILGRQAAAVQLSYSVSVEWYAAGVGSSTRMTALA